MSVCAIVVSYRTGEALKACLAALLAVEGLSEISIADNGNDADGAALIDAAAARDGRVRILRGQGNIGFAAACNLAVRDAQADVLAFVNPDVILELDAITRLSAVLTAAPPPAIVGGDLRDEQGRPERGGRRERLTLWRAVTSFTGLTRLGFRDFNRHTDPLPNAPAPTGAISGALFVIRRADFERLGGFDEGYFLHVEDLDLCRRAEDAGMRVLFLPGPHGRHLRSTSQADARDIARHKARSMARYFRKFAKGPLDGALAVIAGWVLVGVVRR
ncbi:MAG: glycosyltransferase family 2 protein [Hyphomonadaceae bacterium]|nr:glycosyltransferase family 2 protein [Hyphomonadaceae bacterium]